MTANRSLDEFAAGDDASADPDPDEDAPSTDAGATPAGGREVTEDAARRGDDDAAAVEPIAETFGWSPAGGPCPSCGDRVETWWRDGDALVCEGCKEW